MNTDFNKINTFLDSPKDAIKLALEMGIPAMVSIEVAEELVKATDPEVINIIAEAEENTMIISIDDDHERFTEKNYKAQSLPMINYRNGVMVGLGRFRQLAIVIGNYPLVKKIEEVTNRVKSDIIYLSDVNLSDGSIFKEIREKKHESGILGNNVILDFTDVSSDYSIDVLVRNIPVEDVYIIHVDRKRKDLTSWNPADNVLDNMFLYVERLGEFIDNRIVIDVSDTVDGSFIDVLMYLLHRKYVDEIGDDAPDYFSVDIDGLLRIVKFYPYGFSYDILRTISLLDRIGATGILCVTSEEE